MRIHIIHFFYLALFIKSSINAQDFKTLIHTIIPLRIDGKMDLPNHYKHIKLDIGLSYSAPISQHWLSHENDLLVFGFEPNPTAVESILQGASKKDPSHGDPLQKKYIGKSFFLIPCALGLSKDKNIKFFITKDDCGCSSVYAPKNFEVERIIRVPIFALSDFFDVFPFDIYPVIDYIKIDAQGSDLNITKSAGHYLAEHVIYITIEAENTVYKDTVNSEKDIDQYMQGIGFVRHLSADVSDPTYFNPRFSKYIKKHTVKIYQR